MNHIVNNDFCLFGIPKPDYKNPNMNEILNYILKYLESYRNEKQIYAKQRKIYFQILGRNYTLQLIKLLKNNNINSKINSSTHLNDVHIDCEKCFFIIEIETFDLLNLDDIINSFETGYYVPRFAYTLQQIESWKNHKYYKNVIIGDKITNFENYNMHFIDNIDYYLIKIWSI